MSDLRLVNASITRLQTALFCGSDDVGIDVRSSLVVFQMSIGVKGVR